jgi:hypothetical protein
MQKGKGKNMKAGLPLFMIQWIGGLGIGMVLMIAPENEQDARKRHRELDFRKRFPNEAYPPITPNIELRWQGSK